MPRAVQTHLKTQPTPRNRPDPIWHQLTRLLRQLVAGLLHQKPTPAGRFWFPSPQNPKNLNCPTKTQIPAKIFQISAKKTQILAIFQVNLVRFWPDLAKSHQIQWDFRQIWRNLRFWWDFCRIWLFLTVFLQFSHRFLKSMTPTNPSATCWRFDLPDPSTPVVGGGRDFLPPDSVGSVPGWAQTWPGPTHGQPYLCLLVYFGSFFFFFFFDKGLLVCFVSRQV